MKPCTTNSRISGAPAYFFIIRPKPWDLAKPSMNLAGSLSRMYSSLSCLRSGWLIQSRPYCRMTGCFLVMRSAKRRTTPSYLRAARARSLRASSFFRWAAAAGEEPVRVSPELPSAMRMPWSTWSMPRLDSGAWVAGERAAARGESGVSSKSKPVLSRAGLLRLDLRCQPTTPTAEPATTRATKTAPKPPVRGEGDSSMASVWPRRPDASRWGQSHPLMRHHRIYAPMIVPRGKPKRNRRP